MGEYSGAFVGFDTSKTKHAIATAEGGRGGEVRFLDEIASSPGRVEHLVGKLASRYDKLHFCYEAGPTGSGCTGKFVSSGTTACSLCRWRGGSGRKVLCSPIVLPALTERGRKKAPWVR